VLPEPLRDYFSTLEEQPADGRFHRCFGCGPDHPAGLHVRCFRTPDGVAAPIVIPGSYAGPPGVAHGGIVALYLDEVLGAAVLRATGRVAVTGELTVRYLVPVPIETPILGLGRLAADHGRYVDVEAELQEGVTRRRLATARARFFPVRT
jgi:acyl-coenzyme A thioesterase PaaI-like protein